MIGFLFGLGVAAVGLVLIVWLAVRILRFIVGFVDEYASTPRQRLVTWCMVPLAVMVLALALGFVVDLLGFVSSPSLAEVAGMARAAVLGVLFAWAIAALHRAGRFEEKPPVAPVQGPAAPVSIVVPDWAPTWQPRSGEQPRPPQTW